MTLETAKQLKKLGWSVGTLRVWVNEIPIICPAHTTTGLDLINFKSTQTNDMQRLIDKETYPCPSLEEMLAVMPREIFIEQPTPHYLPLELDRKTILWRCGYTSMRPHFLTKELISTFVYCSRHEDPTEAVAMLWIKLRKEGIV